MPQRLPIIALLLGIAGLIPFIAGSYAMTTSPDPTRSRFYLWALTTYGSVILAFLGGVHWGFVLSADTLGPYAKRGAYRLVLGVTPALVGWVGILLILSGLETPALAVNLAGFIALTLAESELRRRGLVPSGYMVLRWGLTVVVCLLLATVIVLRVVGGRLVF